ncbi:MAG: hypothetical protein L0287_22865, partial [Anaerolineae bacterium]|nr:hypothetical protein [Anaerolineae bacterium]
MKLIVIGRPHKILDEILAECGIAPESVEYLNPTGERYVHEPSMAVIREHRASWLKRIQRVRGDVKILGLGGTALKAMRDMGSESIVTDFRGREFVVAGTTKLGTITYDPGSVEYATETDYLDRIYEDVRRLTLPRINWPKDHLTTSKTIGFDAEFRHENNIMKVTDLSIADDTCAVRLGPEHQVKNLFESCRVLHGHVIGGDLTALSLFNVKREDWYRGENVLDSYICARLADENRGKGNYRVDSLLLAERNTPAWKHKTDDISVDDPTKWPDDLRHERVRLDAWAATNNVRIWEPRAEGPVELQTRIAVTLERVKLAGAYVDMSVYKTWAEEVRKQHYKAQQELCHIAWRHGCKDFAPTKKTDLLTLLFNKLKLPMEELTKGGQP